MREILFRGKRKDNGEWIYGDLLQDKDLGQCWIEYFNYYSGDTGLERDYCQYEVIPKTVGQYTGLIDKNAKRIFEGDIIAVPFEEDRSPWEENCTYYENGKVYFDGKRFGWYVAFADDAISLWEYDECDVEIVGNIYDNPKLAESVR